MSKPKIVAHTLVKNEQRWVWFALMSVLDFVDEIMVWDTGSTDRTLEVVSSINSSKIKIKELGPVDPLSHTAARQHMLEATDSDWILILDGDEIWWKSSIASCIDASMHRAQTAALISPFINLVGDIYHYQNSKSNSYTIGAYHGAYNLRFINRKIPGLHVGNPHGRQEYRNKEEVPLQHFPAEKLLFVDGPYLHTTHLPRSVSISQDKTTLKRGFKYRYELGHQFASDFIYPEVLYLSRPAAVPDPFFRRSPGFTLRSMVMSPARFVKSLLIPKKNIGY